MPQPFLLGLIILAVVLFMKSKLYFKLKVYVILYSYVLKCRLKGSKMKIKHISFYEVEEE